MIEATVLGNLSKVDVIGTFFEKTFTFEEATFLLKDKKKYSTLNDYARMAIMQSIAIDISSELGIPNLNIFILLKDFNTGGMALEGNAVAISPIWISDPALAINALAHEIRHIFQDNCYKKKYENQSLFAISLKENVSEEMYWNFPTEVDARKYAMDYATRKKLPTIDFNKRFEKKFKLHKQIFGFLNSRKKLDKGVNKLPQGLSFSQIEFLSNLEKNLKDNEDEVQKSEVKSSVNTSVSEFRKR